MEIVMDIPQKKVIFPCFSEQGGLPLDFGVSAVTIFKARVC
jgi:hypothetical protein